MSAIPNDARRRWAASLIRQAGCLVPPYGSTDWLALAEGSPQKVAAVVIAAECWAVDADDLAERLHRELEGERLAFKRTEDADYQARASAHREQWRHLSVVRPAYVGQQVRSLEEIGAEYVAEQQRGAAQ